MSMSETTRRRLVLLAMTASVSLILFDQTVVSVALPQMGADTGFGPTTSHWIVDSYLVAITAFVIVGGRLGDRFGRKRGFVLGAVVFTVGCALSAVSTGPTVMLIGRVLQGIGAGLMQPTGLAIVSDSYGPEKSGKALGTVIGISSAFLAVGPLVGGFLVDGPGWRSIFIITPLIAVLSAGLALFVVRKGTGDKGRSLDLPGSVLLAGSLTAILVALTEGPDDGWLQPRVIAFLVIGVVLGLLLVWRELRVTAPLIDIPLLRTRAMWTPVVSGLMCQFIIVAMTVYAAIYFQLGMGVSAFVAGLMFLPAVVPVVIAPLAGTFADRKGERMPMWIGSLLLTIGCVATAAGAFMESYPWIAVGLGIVGIGRPFVLTPMNSACIGGAPPEDHAVAAGIASAARFLGGSIGVAVCGAVTAQVLTRMDSVGELAQSRAFGFAMIAMAIAGLIGMWAALMMPRGFTRDRADTPHAAPSHA